MTAIDDFRAAIRRKDDEIKRLRAALGEIAEDEGDSGGTALSNLAWHALNKHPGITKTRHPAVDRVLKSQCACDHDFSDHIVLPGHPDSVEECYGADDCACNHFRRPTHA